MRKWKRNLISAKACEIVYSSSFISKQWYTVEICRNQEALHTMNEPVIIIMALQKPSYWQGSYFIFMVPKCSLPDLKVNVFEKNSPSYSFYSNRSTCRPEASQRAAVTSTTAALTSKINGSLKEISPIVYQTTNKHFLSFSIIPWFDFHSEYRNIWATIASNTIHTVSDKVELNEVFLIDLTFQWWHFVTSLQLNISFALRLATLASFVDFFSPNFFNVLHVSW